MHHAVSKVIGQFVCIAQSIFMGHCPSLALWRSLCKKQPLTVCVYGTVWPDVSNVDSAAIAQLFNMQWEM